MSEFNWTCSFCNHAQTVSDQKVDYHVHEIFIGDTSYDKAIGCRTIAIGCSNPSCKRIDISFAFGTASKRDRHDRLIEISEIISCPILPESKAKNQPEYIPEPIRIDYYEACRIRDLSPKASATLIRRCLQGVIRDFCRVSKNRLIDEIAALRKAIEEGTSAQGITADTIEAIDHVRSIGNIGAHMEKDINVIIDVDPNEAQILIELVEMLFDEWYVARHKREQRLARLKEIAVNKDEAKQPLPKHPITDEAN